MSIRAILAEKSPIVFIASLLVALSSWLLGQPGAENLTWPDLLTVKNVFSMLGTLGAVTAAWFGKSPVGNGGSNDPQP